MARPAHHSRGPSPNRIADVVNASVVQELLWQQIPIIAALIVAGFASAYLQHGYLPGGDRPFPIAGVRVPVWHLIWMGVWTGYTMALVGQAAGIFALPYSTSVLQFSNPHVTPTMLVLTLFNPVGALLGFRRSGQWNLDLAAAVCAGGLAGGFIGPFFRATVLANTDAFRATLGIALALFGLQLCYRTMHEYDRFGPMLGLRFLETDNPKAAPDRGKKFEITTTLRTFSRIGIRFGSEERQLSNVHLFVADLGSGFFRRRLGWAADFCWFRSLPWLGACRFTSWLPRRSLYCRSVAYRSFHFHLHPAPAWHSVHRS